MIQLTPTPLMIFASPTDQKKVITYGDTVYYGGSNLTSSTFNSGSLTSGQFLKLQAPTWFVTAKDVGGGFPGSARLMSQETLVDTVPENGPAFTIGHVPSDADFDYTPPDGTQAVNIATNTVYTRIAGTWTATGGGGGGGGGDSVIIKVDDVSVPELDILTTPVTPPDIGATSTTVDGVHVDTLAISTTAVTAQDVGAIATTQRAVANGVATLGSDGKLTAAQIPSGLTGTVETDPVATAALNTHKTDAAAHASVFAGKIDVGGSIPWATITGAPTGLANPRIGITSTTTTVNTTNLESTLGTFTITGTDTAVADEYEFEIVGDVLNNTGSTQTLNWKLYWGALAFSTGAQNITTSANRRPFRLRSKMLIRAATDNSLTAELNVGSAVTQTFAPVTTALVFVAAGTSATDFTADQTVKLTGTPGVSSSSFEIRAYSALLNRRRAT